MIAHEFEYRRPTTLMEATKYLEEHPGSVRVLAGGTDLVAWLRDEAALRGEPMEAVADRAISSYQAGFSDLDDSTRVPTAGRSRRRFPTTPQEPIEQDPGP